MLSKHELSRVQTSNFYLFFYRVTKLQDNLFARAVRFDLLTGAVRPNHRWILTYSHVRFDLLSGQVCPNQLWGLTYLTMKFYLLTGEVCSTHWSGLIYSPVRLTYWAVQFDLLSNDVWPTLRWALTYSVVWFDLFINVVLPTHLWGLTCSAMRLDLLTGEVWPTQWHGSTYLASVCECWVCLLSGYILCVSDWKLTWYNGMHHCMFHNMIMFWADRSV